MTVAGVAVACAAAGAWPVGDVWALRGLIAAAAAAAIAGAVLMRSWDRAAGRRVAELTSLRTRDTWRAEERIAELETDLEESRELRTALETKLRARRTELTRLRGEYAELLRRYATAETERASALEGRRLLAIEAAKPTRALPAAGGSTGSGRPTPAAYLRADQALGRLTRNAARQQVEHTAQEARRRDLAEREAEEPHGKHAAAAGSDPHSRTAAQAPGAAARDASVDTSVPATRRHRTVPAAAAVVPYTGFRRHVSRAEGGFDFFGTHSAGAPGQKKQRELPAAPGEEKDTPGAETTNGTNGARSAKGAAGVSGPKAQTPDRVMRPVPERTTDIADVIGTEMLAEHVAARRPGGAGQAVGEVIDLTEHDVTEPINVTELRATSG
jgi:hypothetical protein